MTEAPKTTRTSGAHDAEASPAVAGLMQASLKALRAVQLYMPNNPVYHQAMDTARKAFPPVWEERNELVLDVAETDFKCDGAAVLSQPNKQESVAWILFKDGVRTLTIAPGVEDGEFVKLLGVIHKARTLPPDAEDDLLTLLWEQDFQHIQYRAVELAMEDAPPLTPPPTDTKSIPIERVQEEVAEDVSPQRPSGVINLADFDSTLYFLDEGDIAHLKGEIDREYSQDLRASILGILFDLLELQTFSTVRAELISIVENFIPYLLAVGDFRSVAQVLREIRVILPRARELLPEHRQQLINLPARLSQPDALAQLLQSLDEAVSQPSEDELGELFRELRPDTIETVIAWLPKLTNPKLRELLYQALTRLAVAHPQELVRVLGGQQEAVLLEAAKLAGQVRVPAVVPAIGALLTNPSRAVRHVAVEALSAIASPGAMQQLERAIDDQDREVRIVAVRTLSAKGHRAAFPKIEAAVMGKALKTADLTEKMVFFEAFGLLAGPQAIGPLNEMLNGKGFMKRKEEPELRACVAMALGKIGTAEARQALEASAQDKDPLVKNAVNKAMRELRA